MMKGHFPRSNKLPPTRPPAGVHNNGKVDGQELHHEQGME